MSVFRFSLLSLMSAFLLFQVQPLISKFILPWFGGSPGVWTTCLLFFQCVLFLGYAYAHGLMKLPHRVQAWVHGALVLAALALLHIAPSSSWKPTGHEEPVGRILCLLLANVALPYFVLSSTSPLVQVWFSRACPLGSPWRLYALSNVGSLVALLSYPVLVEPRLDVLEQTRWWQCLFVGFGVLSLMLAWLDRLRSVVVAPAKADDPAAVAPRGWQRLLWVLLPAVASAMLLATTNHVCQDVAVVPFLWIAPLSLYLISFIICFEHPRWYQPLLWAVLAVGLLVLAASDSQVSMQMEHSFKRQLVVCLGALFCACMVCHGELMRVKPSTAYLTEFYLLMSLGGALGGLAVSLLAPCVFNTFMEWPLGLMVCVVIAGLALWSCVRAVGSARMRRVWSAVIAIGVGVAFIKMGSWGFAVPEWVEQTRNFYGTVSVQKVWDEEQGGYFAQMVCGRVVHGTQWQTDAWRETPLSYFRPESGVGRALESLADQPGARVGVVGMGAATVAAYGKPGQVFRFYEINPDIVRMAKSHFTYLADFEARGGVLELAMGDGRLSLEREAPQQFDALLLDAFSGDSVPMHLLTVEAFAIYRRHLKPDGIIVVNVTNSHVSLAPVIQKLAAATGYQSTRIVKAGESPYAYTDYALLTNNAAFLAANPEDISDYEGPATKLDPPLWTDLRHDLWGVLERE